MTWAGFEPQSIELINLIGPSRWLSFIGQGNHIDFELSKSGPDLSSWAQARSSSTSLGDGMSCATHVLWHCHGICCYDKKTLWRVELISTRYQAFCLKFVKELEGRGFESQCRHKVFFRVLSHRQITAQIVSLKETSMCCKSQIVLLLTISFNS